MTILDQFGRPYPKIKKAPEHRPLATAPLTDAWRDYVADGLTPEQLAAVFKEADTGDMHRQAELFEQLEERDAHLIGEISKRRNVILDADFTLTPASDSAEDVKIAEDVEKNILRRTDWPDVLVSLQEAVGRGFSALEIFWDVSENQAAIENFEPIEQKRFLFTDTTGVLSKIPRLITDDAPLGIEIPAWKTILHRYGGKSGHPTRSGILRVCAWWYLFKNYSIKDWVVFCEVYGMPLRIGKFDPGAGDEDKEALWLAVKTIGSDAAGIISKNTEIEFVESNRGSVSSDLYEGLARFGNKEMSKAILGATLTADSDGKGAYALGNVHNDVRIDLINADCRATAGTARSQVIRPYVGFNYGWDKALPTYEGKFQKEDAKEHAEIIDTFADRMDIPASHVRKKYNIPTPEKDEELLRPKTKEKSTPVESKLYVAANSLNDSRIENLDILDKVSGRLSEESDSLVQNLLAAVKKIMAKSGSLEEVRDTLSDAFPNMDSAELGKLIAQAMTTTDLIGRYEVKVDG